MSVKREMAKRLGIDLQILHTRLVEAQTTDEITEASVMLGCRFNENIEFICNVLKEFGGMKPH
jgi:hypothetical protein